MAQMVQAGLQFLRNGKVSYVGQLRQQHQKLELNSDDGDMVILTPDAFRREVVDGYIQMLVPAGDGTFRPVSNNWREREGPCSKTQRNKRIQILRLIDEQFKKGISLADIFPTLQEFCNEANLGRAPCERTLRNWRRLAKGHESMLSPAWDRCGNRYQGPDEILLTVIREVVNVCILGNDLFTLSAAWTIVEALYDERWTQLRGTEAIPRHSKKKLKNFVRSMPWSEVMKLRMDGRTARAITRSAVHIHNTGIFWECVEMDATVLNIFVRDEEGNEIGRPILYVAIDSATGYVVGLHLTIQKPSTLPLVECLRFMYFPKPDGFDEKYGIKKRIEVFGKRILLRVDNGSEFIGQAATVLVRQLFGDTARCQPYKPEEKPYVERFNGTLKTYILTLNGATTSSVNGKQRVPRKGETLYTLEELRGEIYRFVYDKYSLLVNDRRSIKCRKAVAPLDIWKEMKATFTEPVPVGREEFERSLCFTRETRALGADGISFDGWMYHSDELASMVDTCGPGRYKFLQSDLDAVTIYVLPPDGGERIAAFAKDLEGTTVDRATATLIKKQLAHEKKELNRRTFAHALAEYRALREKIKSSRGRAKQARADDLLDAAEEHTKRTMPRHKPVTASALLPDSLAGVIDMMIAAPRGRKMGEKR